MNAFRMFLGCAASSQNGVSISLQQGRSQSPESEFSKRIQRPLKNRQTEPLMSGIDDKEDLNIVNEFHSISGYRVKQFDIKTVVEGLAAGNIYARWDGREEFGARALGNRSVVADPSKIENIAKINSTIKSRDFWMPFACTIIDKLADTYLELDGPVEDYKYMTLCAQTREEHRWKIKAGTHPQDGTCRPQIITKADNANYYELIEEFGNSTGIYSLLNTSLNVHGMPIASSLRDAMAVLTKGRLDGLLVSNKLMIVRETL